MKYAQKEPWVAALELAQTDCRWISRNGDSRLTPIVQEIQIAVTAMRDTELGQRC